MNKGLEKTMLVALMIMLFLAALVGFVDTCLEHDSLFMFMAGAWLSVVSSFLIEMIKKWEV